MKQKFADWGTEFDTDNLAGTIEWSHFLEDIKDGKKCRVARIRFLADRAPGGIVFDLSYMYVVVDGKVYDCKGFPLWNGVCRNVGGIKRLMYDVAKKSGVFVPGLFQAFSVCS